MDAVNELCGYDLPGDGWHAPFGIVDGPDDPVFDLEPPSDCEPPELLESTEETDAGLLNRCTWSVVCAEAELNVECIAETADSGLKCQCKVDEQLYNGFPASDLTCAAEYGELAQRCRFPAAAQ